MKVTSSNIADILYNEDTNELAVEFLNGSIYVYQDVPEHIFTEFLEAESHGKYFYANVRDRFIFRKER